MLLAKLSTAKTIAFGPVLDSAGAEYTGAAVGDVKISKNNGTPAALDASATLTHKEVGVYELALTANDISAVGQATITLSKTTYLAPPVRLNILPAKVYDSLVAGSDNLEVDTIQWNGTAVGLAHVRSNLTQIGGYAIGSVPTTGVNFPETVAGYPALDPRQYGFDAESAVMVETASTDADRGTNLAAAYTAAKALTPGGNALSPVNRATVLIPPGNYLRSTTLPVDANYVDLVCTEPEMGGLPLETDEDAIDGSTPLSQCRPNKAVIYSTTAGVSAVTQSVADVRMRGFSCLQLSGDVAGATAHGLKVSVADNGPSIYEDMYFWSRSAIVNGGDFTKCYFPVGFATHVKGTWRRCISNSNGWRVGYDAGHAGQFSPTMYSCYFGAYSAGGDYDELGTHKATNCYLEDCHAIGSSAYATGKSGYSSFCGCDEFAIPIDATCKFVNCSGGDKCGAMGATNAGTWINFRGGDYCLGSSVGLAALGEFSGYAEGCVLGKAGFGGRTGTGQTAKCTGTLKQCVSLGNTAPICLEGATLDGCLFVVTAANKDCVTLLDSASRIHNSTLLVVEGGTGVAINAASAKTVSSAGNRFNNSAAAATGLGANVSNVGTTDKLPSQVKGIDANALDGNAIAPSALNGKGDWQQSGVAVTLPAAPDGYGSAAGAGAVTLPVVSRVGGAPTDGVEVWLSTDEEGSNVVAGALVSDAFGRVTFYVDGTDDYYLWMQKAGVNFTNPQRLVWDAGTSAYVLAD